MGSVEFPTRSNCDTGEDTDDQTFDILSGVQVCREGSPAAGGTVSPEGCSEAEACQEES